MDPRLGVRALVAAIAVFLCLPLANARSLAQKKALALNQFQNAEKMREELNGLSTSERTRRDYNRVIAAYRKVYSITPNSSKADASILASAELLAEEGRAFSDAKSSTDSIKQYQFLIEQYPGSRYKTEALFTIGKIYQEDLQDNENAKKSFEAFLDAHPKHPLSPQARAAIVEIDSGAQPITAKKPPSAQVQIPAKNDIGASSEDKSEGAAPSPTLPKGKRPLVTGIRHWSTPDYTRVVIDLDEEVPYEAGRIPSPDRIFFDLHGTKLAPELFGKSFEVDDGFLKKIRIAQYQPGMTRVVLEVPPVSEYSAFMLPNPERLIIDIHGRQASPAVEVASKPPAKVDLPATAKTSAPVVVATKKIVDQSDDEAASPPTTGSGKTPAKISDQAVSASDQAPARSAQAALDPPAEVKATSKPTTAPTFQEVTPREDRKSTKKSTEPEVVAREAKPVADGQRTLIRALGLKIGRIVVDAGHGGHDTGTIGPHGYMEKDLVLDVALRLGKLLENKLGADVVYTRNDDTFIPLETRTAIANQAQADLFISVHANSSRDSSARGIETYYLNFTSSPDALEVAARENAVSDQSIHELQDLVKKIALKEKIEESREFASDVDRAMHNGVAARAGMRDRGVKKAPFIVLIGANMPSILTEISFLSNPKDERNLQKGDYRQKIAESLYRGVSEYIRGLSGIKMASAAAAAGGK